MEEQAIPFLNEAVGFELLQTTRSASWPGIVIDEVQSPKADFELPSVHSYLIGLHLAGSCNVTQEIDGKVIRGVKVPVSLSIVPNDTVTHWSVDKPNRYAALWLPPELVRDTARDMFEGTQDNARLAPVFDARDKIVERLGAILMQELRRAPHPAQHLIYEAASQAFTAHMLRAYTREIRPIPNATSQLSARAVRDVTDYIDENIQSKITLSELAAIAGSSRFHFIKLFRNTAGLSPMEYLERSRVNRAEILLRGGQLTIAQIASAVGFSDQSHFTRRFRMWTGVTPGHYHRDNKRATVRQV